MKLVIDIPEDVYKEYNSQLIMAKDLGWFRMETLWEMVAIGTPLIRCKDCKYWKPEQDGEIEQPMCKLHGFNGLLGEADDYCSLGEEK